jgi:ribonuclease Z
MFELTFLGTAATTPAAERGLPAMLVGAGGERFLIDCGEGTQRQLLRAGVGFRRLRHVLLTHAHLDHILGLGGLIASLGLFGLRGELSICGSAQTLAAVEHYLGGIWPRRRTPLPLRFEELRPGPVLEGRGYRIVCFPVRHHDTESLGYRFETAARRRLDPARLAALGVSPGPVRARLSGGEPVILPDGRRNEPAMVAAAPAPGSSLVVVGDAEETTSLVEPARGADLLVMEATFLDADAALAAERGHLTAGQSGRLAAEAGVGALWLTHLSGRYEADAVAAEARRYFANCRAAADFDRVRVTASAPRRD